MHLFLVTINENINDLDELLATVDDNYVVLQPYCEDEFKSKHLLQETPISASIGASQSIQKKQSKHFRYNCSLMGKF